MQYTIRRIPRSLDAALRRRARSQGKSLNQVAIEALRRGLGVEGQPQVRRDLEDIANTWRTEAVVEAAIAAQDRTDENPRN